MGERNLGQQTSRSKNQNLLFFFFYPFYMKQLVDVFGSNQKAQEIIYLANNLKPVCRQAFTDSEAKKVTDFCYNNNLKIIKSNFKIQLLEKGFANKGVIVPTNQKGMHIYYISKDETKAKLAAYHEHKNNHSELGQLLGYPACCIEFFQRAFNAKHTNPEIKSDNKYTDISKRHEDNCLISHFPCKKDCSHTINLAQEYEKAIEGYIEGTQ